MSFPAHSADPAVTPEEARAIAKEAYIYGYPIVDSYRIQYAYYVDKNDKSYKAPWNEIKNIHDVFTPADTAIQTPNSDTPYSFAGLDLRAEPIVITVPAIEKSRYYSIQFIDAYTFNFAYVGSRATGNDAGSFLIAGPNWKGEKPEGIKEIIRSDTEFDMVLFRTQLFNAADIENVEKIQAQYKLQPLSEFLGKPAPAAAPAVNWLKPLTQAEEKTAFEQGRADAYEAFAGQVKLMDSGNSPMLPEMKKDADGGLTIYIQNESPGKDKQSNWLPAPKGPFAMYMRLYWPGPAALDGSWKQPPLVTVK